MEAKWKLEGDLCRCCHTEGNFTYLGVSENEEEKYCDMLRDHLNITISPVDGLLADITYKICENCIHRLKECVQFRQQVLSCEEKFQDMYIRNVFKVVEPFNVKLEYDADEDACGADVKEDLDDKDSLIDFSDDDERLTPQVQYDVKKETVSEPVLKKLLLKEPLKKGKGKAKAPAKSKPTLQGVKKRPSRAKKSITKPATKEPPAATDTTGESAPAEPKKKGKVSQPKFVPKEHEDYTIINDFRKYVCKRCDKRYQLMQSLQWHIMSQHLKMTKWQCSLCPKSFTFMSELNAHKIEEHGVDDRFKCNACDQTFSKKIRLTAHINGFHMMGKLHKCQMCDFETYNYNSLSRHRLNHKTERDFKCKFCPKAFVRRSTLALHERIHTGDKRKVCSVCQQAFVQKASLNYHMAKHHPEVPF